MKDADNWRRDFQTNIIREREQTAVFHVKTAVQMADRHVITQRQRRCEDNRGSLHRNSRDIYFLQEKRRSRGRFGVAIIQNDVGILESE